MTRALKRSSDLPSLLEVIVAINCSTGDFSAVDQVGDGRDVNPTPIILLKVDETKDTAEVVRPNKKKE